MNEYAIDEFENSVDEYTSESNSRSRFEKRHRKVEFKRDSRLKSFRHKKSPRLAQERENKASSSKSTTEKQEELKEKNSKADENKEQQDTAAGDKENNSDEEEDEEDTDSSEIAKDKSTKEKQPLKDQQNLRNQNSETQSYFISSHSPFANSNSENNPLSPNNEENSNEEDEQNTALNNNQTNGSGSGSNSSNADDINRRLSDIELSTLEEHIADGNYEEVQNFVNSSELSSFRRQTLAVLVSASQEIEDNQALTEIIRSSYFNTNSLSLYTLSLVQDEFSFEERAFMSELLTQDIFSAPARLTQDEFVELYFNSVRSILPTPEQAENNQLSSLYIDIDSSIEETFVSYQSGTQPGSRIALDQ